MSYETIAQFVQTWNFVYFGGMFVAVLVYALRPAARRKFDEAALIPLKED